MTKQVLRITSNAYPSNKLHQHAISQPKRRSLAKYIAAGVVCASVFGFGISHAQVTPENWRVGGGLTYPKFFSSNIDSRNFNYGAYISGQRNMSQHVGLRLKGSYSHLEGEWLGVQERTNLGALDLGLLFYIVPCEPISPYLFSGIGLNVSNLTNKASSNVDENTLGGQLNFGFGAEFKIKPALSLVTEFGYNLTNNSELDGAVIASEINGRDSYITLGAGINYQFGKGGATSQCQQCMQTPATVKDLTDYQRIEDLIIEHIPKEVIKEINCEANKDTVSAIPAEHFLQEIDKGKLVLVGVNFDFDKSNLLAESYPVLDKVVGVLNERPDVMVEIAGYTDDVGSLAYNRNLSAQRAERVKAYLVAQGIANTRLTTFGYGKRNPIEDNLTVDGREMNRRIVFRIVKSDT